MNVPLEPVIIAEQGGVVVAESGPLVVVIDRGNGPLQIVAFVLLVVTLVFGGFGAVSMDVATGDAKAAPPVVVSAALLAVGIVAAIAMLLTVNVIRARRRRNLSSFTPVAVFDRAQRVYANGAGEVIAPLDQVRFERQMQMTSSSPRLVAVTPYGTPVLKRGNPFGGGIGNIDEVLSRVVFQPREP